MIPSLCIGIASRDEVLEVAAREGGGNIAVFFLPGSSMGIAAIRIILADYAVDHTRVVASGKNAIDLALTLGNVPGGEAFVVAAEAGKEAADLVRYATRVLCASRR